MASGQGLGSPPIYESFETEQPQAGEKKITTPRWLAIVVVILLGIVCFSAGIVIGQFAAPREGMSYIRIKTGLSKVSM